jgi:hypothetical protein
MNHEQLWFDDITLFILLRHEVSVEGKPLKRTDMVGMKVGNPQGVNVSWVNLELILQRVLHTTTAVDEHVLTIGGNEHVAITLTDWGEGAAYAKELDCWFHIIYSANSHDAQDINPLTKAITQAIRNVAPKTPQAKNIGIAE